MYTLFLLFSLSYSLQFLPHPLEKRISYVEGIDDIRYIGNDSLKICKENFKKKYPMLIFKNNKNITPQEFLNFAKQFDDNCDEEAIKSTEEKQSYIQSNQMLQPFDQFPDCKHVAPRGNYFLKNYYGCENLQVSPSDYFKDKYLWHSDTWGHNSKRMNKITAFHIKEQPLIGGETDFISGETVYENLSSEYKRYYKNIIVQVSREPFLKGHVSMDYSGAQFLENISYVKPSEESITKVPIITFPEEDSYSKPCLLVSPILVQCVEGYSIEKSRILLTHLVNRHLLPNRVTIQWKKGDIAIFNNKLFIHSSTPANNYLQNKFSNKRFLLQTFIPTK